MLIGSRLRHVHAGGEDGQALVLVVFLIFVLGLLSPLLMDTISATSKESNDSLVQAKAHAAAEAGINEYVAKLLNDTQYYAQYVAPGEATRQSGVNIVASVLPPATPTAWTYGTTWTYPNGKDAWVDLGNGFSYDLEITPPQTGTNTTNFLLITATGKSNLSADIANDRQVVQMLIRPASVADFQMFSAGSVCYGDGAITNGKIYTQGNLYFSGTAKADLNAESNIYLPPTNAQGGDPCGTGGDNNTGTVVPPAVQYNHTNIRSAPELATKPNFSAFQVSLVDIKRAAQFGKGIYLGSNPASTSTTPASAWQITFNSNGTVTYKSCKKTSNPVQSTQPTCDGSVPNQGSVNGVASTLGTNTVALPVNGAIYSDQTVIIAGGTSSCLSGGNAGGPTGSHVALTNAGCVKGRVQRRLQRRRGRRRRHRLRHAGRRRAGPAREQQLLHRLVAPGELEPELERRLTGRERLVGTAVGHHFRLPRDDVPRGLDRTAPDGERHDPVRHPLLQLRPEPAVPAASVVPDAAEQLPGAALPRSAERQQLARLSSSARGPARSSVTAAAADRPAARW